MADRPSPIAAHATRTLGLGALAVGLAVLPYKLFELDRFFVPKEVALQLTAAGALLAIRPTGPGLHRGGIRSLHGDSFVDAALVLFLAASAAGTLVAPSGWLAARAFGVSAAGIALFWAARATARAGRPTPVLAAAALVPAIAAATALAQTYGAHSEYFSVNRAPGGTFGNRNFVAHLCAVGLPVLAYLALSTRRAAGVLAATAALAAATAALVLTRSRGAWLAAAVALVPFAIGVWRAAAARRAEGRPTGPPSAQVRVGFAPALAVTAAVAATAAVRLPNTLDWRSRSPYLDSARDVVNYREGSGRGRLAQWRNSARLIAQAPMLGVGPGNWSVRYPAVAPANDPSLTDVGATANPWPSSDWVAFATERGIAGSLPLAVAFVLLLHRAHRLVWHTASAADRLRGGTLGGLVGATLTAGAFDAVLLLAAPAFLAWAAAGALVGADNAAAGRPLLPRGTRALALLLLAAAAVGTAHVTAMGLFSTGRARAVERAAALAPGDYRIQLRSAQLAAQVGRCEPARQRAAAAQRLTGSSVPARVRRSCRADRRARTR